MSIVLRTSDEDLLRCRFAISPLGETADALRSLARPAAIPAYLAWQRQTRADLPALDIGPLAAMLTGPGYQPDFLNPAPASPFTDINAELAQVRATPPQQGGSALVERRTVPRRTKSPNCSSNSAFCSGSRSRSSAES